MIKKYKAIQESSCKGCVNDGYRKISCYRFIKEMEKQDPPLPRCAAKNGCIYVVDVDEPQITQDNLGEIIRTN